MRTIPYSIASFCVIIIGHTAGLVCHLPPFAVGAGGQSSKDVHKSKLTYKQAHVQEVAYWGVPTNLSCRRTRVERYTGLDRTVSVTALLLTEYVQNDNDLEHHDMLVRITNCVEIVLTKTAIPHAQQISKHVHTSGSMSVTQKLAPHPDPSASGVTLLADDLGRFGEPVANAGLPFTWT